MWVLGNLDQLDSPAEVLMIGHGGLTLCGGILGGLVIGVVMVRRHHLAVAPMLDYAAPGLVIGRVSDLITGDRYVGVHPPVGAIVHPVAPNDALLVAGLFALLVLYLRRPRPAGAGGALFALCYASDRILLDVLRTDGTRALSLTSTQLASVVVLAAVGPWLLRRRGPAAGANLLSPVDADLSTSEPVAAGRHAR